MRHQLMRYRPGLRPPARVLAAMRRSFPDVVLMWEARRRRWAMVQVRRGQRPWLIALLQGPGGEFQVPTMRNTVQSLRASHWSLFRDRFAVERLERQMDEAQARHQAEASKRASEPWQEGAERLRRLFSPKLVVPR